MAVIPREASIDPRPWAAARRVACVRVDGMGDVVMTGPAIRALAASGPSSRRVTVVTSPAGAGAARMLPGVDEVISVRAPWVAAGADAPISDDLAMVKMLREHRFDAAVIFTVSTQSALPAAMMCRLAGIELRLAHARENPYGLLTDWIPEPEVERPMRHEVRRQIDLAAAVCDRFDGDEMRVSVTMGQRRQVRELLVSRGIEPGRMVVIHPGASAASRRYPPEGFARAADDLAARGRQMVITGGPEDAPSLLATVGSMMSTPAAVFLDLGIGELTALLSLAPVVVTNNTGPAHLAAAVGTPVVDLYALTNLQHAPWGVPHRLLFNDVPCADCRRSVCPEGHHACLRGVPYQAIVEAVHALGADQGGHRLRERPTVVTSPSHGSVG
jgi:ADP-heptose:LPS heptosyltransferase